MDYLQPAATIFAALLGGGIVAFFSFRLQNRKRNDAIDQKALEYSLEKKLTEFKTSLAEEESFLLEKGKNEALIEDIEKLTKLVESVKVEFTETTEVLKWQLSKKANLHKLQAEKEFDVYSRIWKKVIKMKFAASNLRPVFDTVDRSENKMVRWNSRYERLNLDHFALRNEIECQRPFYPHELYIRLNELLKAAWGEITSFEAEISLHGANLPPAAYKKGQENLAAMESKMVSICDLMRERISE